jgi:hypothetical protein
MVHRATPSRQVPRKALVASPSATGEADGWGAFAPAQRQLLGPDGRQVFESLSCPNQIVFSVVSRRLVELGLDVSGLKVAPGLLGISKKGLTFVEARAQGLSNFEDSVRGAIGSGVLQKSGAFALMHGKTRTAARENLNHRVLHLGVGEATAFAHLDEFNPAHGAKTFLGHTGEFVKDVVGRYPDPSVWLKPANFMRWEKQTLKHSFSRVAGSKHDRSRPSPEPSP